MPDKVLNPKSNGVEHLSVEPIGEGAFGEVFLKESGNEVVKRQPLDIQGVKEVYLLKLLDHPSILKINKVFCSNEDLYIEMPMIPKLDYVNIADLPKFFEDMFEVVRYLHSQNLCHRDICNENILYDLVKRKPYLIDFGAASLKTRSSLNYCHINFAAPESLSDGVAYDSKALDIWSLGMVFLMQISNYSYPHNMSSENFYYYYKGRFGFGLDQANLNFTAETFKPMVQDMLQFDPRKRLSADQLLNKYFPMHQSHLHIVIFDELITDALDLTEMLDFEECMSLNQVLQLLSVNREEDPTFLNPKLIKLRHMVKNISCKKEAHESITFYLEFVETVTDRSKKIDLIIEFFELLLIDQSLKYFSSDTYFNTMINKCNELALINNEQIKEIMTRCKQKIIQTSSRWETRRLFDNKLYYYMNLKEILVR